MYTIYKYPVKIADSFQVVMPSQSAILTVQIDQKDGLPYFWAGVDTNNTDCIRFFEVYGTGNPMETCDGDRQYIGTFQSKGYVWHLFEFIP